jgi:hypothetical protein
LHRNQSINLKAITGSGHVTTRTELYKSLKVLKLATIDLIIEQSNKTEIIVTADDNLQKKNITKVENGVLIISCDYNSL